MRCSLSLAPITIYTYNVYNMYKHLKDFDHLSYYCYAFTILTKSKYLLAIEGGRSNVTNIKRELVL